MITEERQEILNIELKEDRLLKVCSFCFEEKVKSLFRNLKKSHDGKRSVCKLCRRKQHTLI